MAKSKKLISRGREMLENIERARKLEAVSFKSRSVQWHIERSKVVRQISDILPELCAEADKFYAVHGRFPDGAGNFMREVPWARRIVDGTAVFAGSPTGFESVWEGKGARFFVLGR